MYQFKCILKTDTLNLFTNPMWWVGGIGLPLLLALVMGFITKGAYGGGVSSYDYYALTMLVFGALNNATVAANSFMEGRIVKANMRLCTAPLPDSFIYLPKIVASTAFGLACTSATMLLLALAAGANLGSMAAFGGLWLLLAAVNLFAVCLGILCCCLLKVEETVNMLLSTLVMALCVLGGGFFPVKGLGAVARTISGLSPVAWLNGAGFQLVYDGRPDLMMAVCGGMLGLSLLCVALIFKWFNREDYL